jgi:hypothetical protein
MVIFNVTTAVIIALAWMAGAKCWRWATQRPVSGLPLLTLGIMTIRTVFTLATGNTLSILLSGAIITLTLTAVVATVVWSVIVGRQEGLPRPAGHPEGLRTQQRGPSKLSTSGDEQSSFDASR